MRKDLVEKIKKQLKSLFTSKFAQVKAGDLMISTPDEVLSVGSEVFMLDEQGNNVPLTDGEYILDSGEKIEVLSGKITEISAPEVEEVEVEAGKKVEDKMKTAPEVEKEEEDKMKPEMMAKIEKMEKQIEELMKKYEDMAVEKEKMKQEFSKIAQQPSTKSIEIKPSEFKSVDNKKTSASNLDLSAIVEKAKKLRG